MTPFADEKCQREAGNRNDLLERTAYHRSLLSVMRRARLQSAKRRRFRARQSPQAVYASVTQPRGEVESTSHQKGSARPSAGAAVEMATCILTEVT